MKKQSLPSSVALYSTEQIKMIEQKYAQHSASGTYPLMKKAGAAAFHHLELTWPDARRIIIVTGRGNNAGDGFIVAKLATERRFKVDLCSLVDPKELTGDAATAYRSIPHRAIQTIAIEDVKFSEYDLIVDAMLGTGIQGKLREPYLSAVKRINGNKTPVLAIDIPTGVEADTGFVYSEAIRATLTVTFVGQKKGMYTGDAANYRGRVQLSNLDIPSKFYDQHTFHLISQNWHSLKNKLQPRENASHKGLYGHTIIIGGQKGMSGAAILAATSAAKSGSGLTTAWTSDVCAQALNCHTPEVMALAINQDEILQQLSILGGSSQVFVVGPGLGQEDWCALWIEAISKHKQLRESPQIWDADALNRLAELDDNHINKYNAHRILTPHPGEAARLLQTSTHAIGKDRYAAALEIARRYGGVCILKGAGTIISDKNGFQVVCPVGNPGMASGGMGDVLAGLVGGLLAQKFSLMDAATLAVSIHGEAADLAAGPREYYRGLLASDLFKHFPALLNPFH